ncbi:MAG: TonB family protein [Steroidobacter sp.]
MSAITVNTFPSINSFTSARGWFLAIIVLLHLGFFWALSNGLSIRTIMEIPRGVMIDVPTTRTDPPPVRRVTDQVEIDRIYVARRELPPLPIEEENETAVEQITDIPPPPVERRARPEPAPVIAEPQIDPRTGLSEPAYPAPSIRGNETGTVLLSVRVLENGRVGEVRIEQSSGHARLDEAAVREARRWRLRPGTSDGVPVAMWKQIPITFRLKESVKL